MDVRMEKRNEKECPDRDPEHEKNTKKWIKSKENTRLVKENTPICLKREKISKEPEKTVK